MPYTTSDFDFVAFALANDTPKVVVKDLKPYPSPSARHSGKGTHYVFELAAPDGSDVEDQLEKLALRFANGETVIDPTQFLRKRRMLRGLSLDQDKRNRKPRSRRGRGAQLNTPLEGGDRHE